MGEKVATATISPANEYGYRCVLDWFAISPKAQGLKLSKPLLSKVLQTAKNLGYDKMLLHTQTHTWLAAKVYLDMGFNPYNVEEDYLGWQILKKITNHEKTYINETFSWDNTVYDLLSVSLYYLGDYDKALEYVKKALEMSPDDERLKNNLKLIIDKCGKNVQ